MRSARSRARSSRRKRRSSASRKRSSPLRGSIAALWKQLAEANLLGIAIDEAHGGMGMGFPELCILLEEAGRVCAPGPWLGTLVGAALPLGAFGSDAQREAWLPKIADGSAVLTFAADDVASADPFAPATRAEPVDDGFRLTGGKRNVPFAGEPSAVLVPATTPNGVAVFVVPTDAPGLSVATDATSTGEPLATLTLEGVAGPPATRVSPPTATKSCASSPSAGTRRSRPFRWASATARSRSRPSTRPSASSSACPSGSFQAVQHRQADGFIDLHAMRLATQRAVWRIGEGLPSAMREAALAKYWTAAGGARIASACVHLHGGLGADVDYPIHRYFYWSKTLELTGGSASQTLAALGADLAASGPTPLELQ